MVNIKPSRIGGLTKLCAAYDYCAEHGIGAYGGGQFELGPGRGQAQYLASLFHPDTPNDLAPVGYNENDPPAGLPDSPLAPAPARSGFRWGSRCERGAARGDRRAGHGRLERNRRSKVRRSDACAHHTSLASVELPRAVAAGPIELSSVPYRAGEG